MNEIAPIRFQPIRYKPVQLQVAKATIRHARGMGFATIIGRSRFTPRQQMNADDGKRPFYPEPKLLALSIPSSTRHANGCDITPPSSK